MKKFVLTAIAAGALAAGTAASAQDLGTVLGSIFGYGQPTYSQGIPAVVAGTQQGTVYTDSYGRQFYYDQYGRQVFMNNTNTQQIVGYDQWGRPVYGSTSASVYGANNYPYPNGNYAYGSGTYRRWDRDGDGIANRDDRYPDDPRYR
jgi:hypothetical protein